MLWPLVVLLFHQSFVECYVNNACKSYSSYFNIYFSSNCYYIPDNTDDVPEISKRHTGVSETHKVTTSDGYILTVFRIPRKSPKGVILFQHGVGQDSRAWLAQYNESIALLFWRNGYDIWLGNSRGCHYSKDHVKLKTDEAEYWDFSYHEMGYYDLNATIEYIKNITNVDKIFYVGHSMGAISGVIYTSLRPEDSANSVKLMVLLAPVCYSQDAVTPFVTFVKYADLFINYNLHKLTSTYSFPENDSFLIKVIRVLNRLSPFKYITTLMISYVAGWSPDEFDPNYINSVVDMSGSGAALKIYSHGYQLTLPNTEFQMYDYGKEGNLKMYGYEKPPLYPLEDIKVPLFTVYGQNDTFSFEANVKLLYDRLRPEANFGRKEIRNFNHVDFYWGKRRNEAIYNEVLKIFDDASDSETRDMCPKDSPF